MIAVGQVWRDRRTSGLWRITPNPIDAPTGSVTLETFRPGGRNLRTTTPADLAGGYDLVREPDGSRPAPTRKA